MLWQGAKWRILKNFNVQNEECHNYEIAKACGLGNNQQSHAKWSTQVHTTLLDGSSSHDY